MRYGILLALFLGCALSVPFDKDIVDRGLDEYDATFGITTAPETRALDEISTRDEAGLDLDDDDDDDDDDDFTRSLLEREADKKHPNKHPKKRHPNQPKNNQVPTTYSQIAVFAHNLHRKNHSAQLTTWSKSLAKTAQKIADSCVFAHNGAVDGGGYGQNIAAGVKSDNISAVITNLWYNSEVNWYHGLYGQSQPTMKNFGHWGHFSQIVWKNSVQIGCYTADCSKHGLKGVGGNIPPYFTVCNYHPPGNYANEYGKNIGKPLGHPSANWNTGLGHNPH